MVDVDTAIRKQVFTIRHLPEVRRTEAGDAILARLPDGAWVPLEGMEGINAVPPEERYKIILAVATAADKSPRLETLPVTQFRLDGRIEEDYDTYVWAGEDGTRVPLGRSCDGIAMNRLAANNVQPKVLSLRWAPKNRWRRVIASVGDDGHIFGRGLHKPLAVMVFCQRLATRHVRLVVETQSGLVVAGYTVDRTGQRTEIRTGAPLRRRLVATYDAAGEPCVVFLP